MHNWLTVAQIESETLKDAYKAQKITSTYVNELYRGVILGMFKSLAVLYRSNARSVFYALVPDMYLNLF